jgi:hypothetical protein
MRSFSDDQDKKTSNSAPRSPQRAERSTPSSSTTSETAKPDAERLTREREARLFAEDLVARLALELLRVIRTGAVPAEDRDRVEDLLSESWRRLGGLDRL